MIGMDLVFEPTSMRHMPAETICGEIAGFMGGELLDGHLATGFTFRTNGRVFRCHIATVRDDGTPVIHVSPAPAPAPAPDNTSADNARTGAAPQNRS